MKMSNGQPEFTPEEVEFFSAIEKAMSENAKRLVMLLGFHQTRDVFDNATNIKSVARIMNISVEEVESAMGELYLSGMATFGEPTNEKI